MTLIESLNRTFLCLIAFFTIVLGAVYFLATSLDPQILKKITVKEIQTVIGHRIEVRGAFNIRLWPIPIVKMNDVHLVVDDHTHIAAKTVTLKLDLLPLIKTWSGPESKRDIDIDSFIMDNVNIDTKLVTKHYKVERISGLVKANKISSIDFKMQQNKSDLKGKFTFEKNRILGDLSSHFFDIKELPSLEDLTLLFSNSSTLNTKLNLVADAFKTNSILLKKVKATAKIEKDKIILSPLHADVAQGIVQGSIILEKHQTQLHLQAKGILLEEILSSLYGQTSLQGGKTDVTLFATGEGRNFSHILETLTGRALFVMKDATLRDVKLQTSVSQMFFQIFPFKKRERHTHIQCAVLRLNLQNGIAYAINNFGLETPEFNILGSGRLNLKTQEINLEIVNKPKGGLSIEVGQFAKYVTIKGTLEDPKISFNPKGLIRETLSLIAGIATGGVSTVAEQLLKLSENNTSACYAIINKKNVVE